MNEAFIKHYYVLLYTQCALQSYQGSLLNHRDRSHGTTAHHTPAM